MKTAENPQNCYDSLQWYAEMGVDLCVEDTPQAIKPEKAAARPSSPLEGESTHSFSASVGGQAARNTPHGVARATPAPSQGGSREQAAAPVSVVDAIAEARKLADAAEDLPILESSIRSFNSCALKKTATNTVFAEGVPESRLMFIGEAPGAEEDKKGVPFCGASGQLLDKMLSFIGLTRAKNFYITNTLFWRPPGNRQPSKEELEICRPFVEKHIALVNPKILVLVGGTATSAMLQDTRGITRLRGQVFSYKNDYMAAPVPVHVIYHPSYLLRQPMAKKQCWADLLALKDALSQA